MPRPDGAALTDEERKAAFFAAMKAEKERGDAEKARAAEAALAAMAPEERSRLAAEAAARAAHEEKKSRMLSASMGMYSTSSRQLRGAGKARGGARGRGRGK